MGKAINGHTAEENEHQSSMNYFLEKKQMLEMILGAWDDLLHFSKFIKYSIGHPWCASPTRRNAWDPQDLGPYDDSPNLVIVAA
jgi:hypothetical protein